jgi:hypothetical protein
MNFRYAERITGGFISWDKNSDQEIAEVRLFVLTHT